MAIRSSNNGELSRLLSVVIAVAVISALYFAKVVFVPLALAMLFAFVLTPVVMVLERARLGRALATMLVLVVVLSAIGMLGWVITRQFAEVINELPYYQSNIEDKIDSLHLSKSSTLRNASATISEINRALVSPPDGENEPGSNKRASGGRGIIATPSKPLPVQIITPPALPLESLQSALEFLLQVLIVIVFTSFMLIQREGLRNRFISLIGQRQVSVLTQALDEASGRVSRYLRTQVAMNTIYGSVIGIGLHFIGIPGALLWGVIVGILRFLPYVGPPLGGIMPVLLSLAIFPGWKITLLTLAMFVAVEFTMSYVIEPMIYGAHAGISSLAILVAAIFWTVLWGPVGLVLSTPLTVCIVVLGRYVPHLGFLPVLFGGNPDLAEDTLVYQRLLAMDQDEAEQILESALERESLAEVYDTVLIPALNMAEQDRHRGQIDENTAKLVFQNTREIIDELYERSPETGRGGEKTEAEAGEGLDKPATRRAVKIACVAARDEADELAALMLTQLLQQAGEDAACIPRGSASETVNRVKQQGAEIVCISALPPFVVSHSRALCRALSADSPGRRIVVGLWTLAGDATRLARRLGTCDEAVAVATLSDALREVGYQKKLEPDSQTKSSFA